MATFPTEFTKRTVADNIQRTFRDRKKSKALGNFALRGTTTVAAASYDVLYDFIELMEFPDGEVLLNSVSVTADKEYDTGGTAVRFGLVLRNNDTSSYTSAAGGAFANQPANDSVSVHSDDAGDTTQIVTIIGTTTATDTVVVEEIALDGTNVVDSVKLDWGQILAVKLSASCAGTVTVEENSGNADIITLATGVLSKGVNEVTSTEQAFYDRLVKLVCSGSGTKQVGLKGTDTDGTVIYDSQALNGTTPVLSNSRFVTVTEFYTGDLESTRTATISGTDALLVTGSQAFTADPIPLNWTGGSLPGTQIGVECGGQKLGLLVEAAPTTANTGDVSFVTVANVAIGATDLGTSN